MVIAISANMVTVIREKYGCPLNEIIVVNKLVYLHTRCLKALFVELVHHLSFDIVRQSAAGPVVESILQVRERHKFVLMVGYRYCE